MSLLFALLDQGTRLVWPTQKAQELLFDLGERKSPSSNVRQEAVEECASWWESWGVEVDDPIPCEFLTWASVRHSLQLSKKEEIPGVAKDLVDLADLVGLSPKTLANNLSQSKWRECKRPEHRWILFLGRTLRAEKIPKGFLYHRRSIAALNLALAHSYGHLEVGQLDSADAMLLFNLVSYWQRRRPTQDVRSNRNQIKSRRKTPKPIVGLSKTLLEKGIFHRNLCYLLKMEANHALPLLFELALTEAHLAPHSKRATSSAEAISSPHWLELIEKALKQPEVLSLLGEDGDLFEYRMRMMKAYRDKQPLSAPSDSVIEHPYVASNWCLSQLYWTKQRGEGTEPFLAELHALHQKDDWEGKAVQISQIQSKLERIPK